MTRPERRPQPRAARGGRTGAKSTPSPVYPYGPSWRPLRPTRNSAPSYRKLEGQTRGA